MNVKYNIFFVCFFYANFLFADTVSDCYKKDTEDKDHGRAYFTDCLANNIKYLELKNAELNTKIEEIKREIINLKENINSFNLKFKNKYYSTKKIECEYPKQDKNYENCIFSKGVYINWSIHDPENGYFENAEGIPNWISAGLSEDNHYHINILLNKIRSKELINLESAYLRDAYLQHANLKGCKFKNSNLSGAKLDFSEIDDPSDNQENWEGANLENVTWINGRKCGLGSKGHCIIR